MSRSYADSGETERLLDEIETGNREAFNQLFLRHQPRLLMALQRRLDGRIRPRVDSSDVRQEVHLRALKRLDDYLDRRPMPFQIWLHKELGEQIRKLEREHIEAQMRTVAFEVPLPSASEPKALAGSEPSPSEAAQRHEAAAEVRSALAHLSESDREMIVLRGLEHRSCSEIAGLLEITTDAAQKRYRRALVRLQRLLHEDPG